MIAVVLILRKSRRPRTERNKKNREHLPLYSSLCRLIHSLLKSSLLEKRTLPIRKSRRRDSLGNSVNGMIKNVDSIKHNDYTKSTFQIQQANIKASAHSFKRFTSRLLKLSFPLSMHLLPRMNVMLDFIWTLPVQLRGTRNKWTLQKILRTVGVEPTTPHGLLITSPPL